MPKKKKKLDIFSSCCHPIFSLPPHSPPKLVPQPTTVLCAATVEVSQIMLNLVVPKP